MIAVWIGVIVLGYVFLVWVVVPSVVPFMRLRKLPSRVPAVYTDAIERFEQRATNEYEYLKLVVNDLLSTNTGARLVSVLRLDLAFHTDLKKLFHRRGFMHAHQFNHLLRILLVKSKFFSDEDFRIRTVFLNFFIHQYAQVHISGQWYDVDIGAAYLGVPLGKHASGLR